MSGPRYQVSVRDADLLEVAPVGAYASLQLKPVFRDVGTWTLRLPLDHPQVGALCADDAGIVVRVPGSAPVVLSGPVVDVDLVDGAAGTATFVGVTDAEVLSGEAAFPDPATDVPTDAAVTFEVEADVFAGPAEDALLHYLGANIGPAAPIARRAYPWLALPASAGRGPVGTWRPRFQSLLELCQEIATFGGLGFDLAQDAPGTVAVRIWEPAQRLEARFSRAAGTLTLATLRLRPADTTEVIAGTSTDGLARAFTRRVGADAGRYARRRLRYTAASGSTLAEQQQAADTELARTGATAGITLTAVDSPSLAYGRDYAVGDIVSAVVGSRTVTDTVVAVTVTDAPGQPVSVVPSLGLADEALAADTEPLARDLARSLGRIVRS